MYYYILSEQKFINQFVLHFILQSGVIPLVLGRRSHYELLAPPMSYIQADSFASPKELASYLHLLDKNDDLYNKYVFFPLSLNM